MRKSTYILALFFGILSCGEAPTQFPEDILNDSFVSIDGQNILLKNILEKHKGEQILIDVWASWCRDCIVGIPDVADLQTDFPDVKFVFLSVDRSEVIWKKSLKRYDLKGNHYFIPDGQKGIFGDFLNSNWIPRYMVVDKQGNIKLFKAKKATDIKIREALTK